MPLAQPNRREQAIWQDGYKSGYREGYNDAIRSGPSTSISYPEQVESVPTMGAYVPRKPKRKLSAWNKFVKANAKKPRFRLRSGAPNLKKLGVAFRKTPAGRKKKRR